MINIDAKNINESNAIFIFDQKRIKIEPSNYDDDDEQWDFEILKILFLWCDYKIQKKEKNSSLNFSVLSSSDEEREFNLSLSTYLLRSKRRWAAVIRQLFFLKKKRIISDQFENNQFKLTVESFTVDSLESVSRKQSYESNHKASSNWF